jgi:tetratricopeptide (TPR) repeat protein
LEALHRPTASSPALRRYSARSQALRRSSALVEALRSYPPALAALACLVLFAVASCSRPVDAPQTALIPVELGDTSALDVEVVEVVRTRMKAVQSAPTDARAHGSLGLACEANKLWSPAAASFANAAQLEPAQPLWRFHRAITLNEAGDSEQALSLMEAVARELPNDAAVQHRAGQYWLDAGESARAVSAFQRALAVVPGRSEFLTSLAQALLALGDDAEALKRAEEAVRADPKYMPARYALGSALRALGRDAEAAPHLAAGLNSERSFAADRFASELQSYAVNWVNQNAQANALMAQRRFAESASIWEHVSAKRPDDVQILVNLAAARIELREFDRAIEILERARTLDPNEFAVYLNLADCHLRAGRLDAALVAAKKSVELGGAVSRTHELLARVLANQDRHQDAYLELQRAVALDARNPMLRVALMEMCMQLDLLAEALTSCREALRIDPNLLAARVPEIILLVRNQRVDEGWAAFVALEKQAPNHPQVQNLREKFRKMGR